MSMSTSTQRLTKKDLVRAILWFGSEKDEEGRRFFDSKIKLQKLIFILQNDENVDLNSVRELYSDVMFMFRPHKYGPYSRDLELLLKELEEADEIEIEDQKYFLKPRLKECLNQKYELLKSENFKTFLSSLVPFFSMSSTQILRYVYSQPEYEGYLKASLIAHKYKSE